MRKKEVLWTGFHTSELSAEIRRALHHEQLLILCPPGQVVPEMEFPREAVMGVFTSGSTTGQRKLVFYSRECLEASINGILKFFDVAQIDHIFCYPQPFHTFGLVLGYVMSVMKGFPLSSGPGKYCPAFHSRWLETLTPGTLTLGTPAHFVDLLDYVRAHKISAPESYSCIIGGAPVSPELWSRAKSELAIRAPSVGYGCTEASPGLTHLPPGQAPRVRGEVGYVIPGVELGMTAEGLRFSGPNLCLAVVSTIDGKPEISYPQTYWVQDRMRVDDSESWYFEGRLDRTLNRGGEKFDLDAMEGVLKDRAHIDAFCLAVDHERLGSEVGVLALKDSADDGSIRSCLRDVYGRSFDGIQVRYTDQMPTNASLKPDRQAIQSQWKELS